MSESRPQGLALKYEPETGMLRRWFGAVPEQLHVFGMIGMRILTLFVKYYGFSPEGCGLISSPLPIGVQSSAK